MSNSDTRIDSILAALERFSSSLSQQLEFNQQTDQRIANLVNRLNQFENRFNNLETLIKASSNDSKTTSITQSTPRGNSDPHQETSWPSLSRCPYTSRFPSFRSPISNTLYYSRMCLSDSSQLHPSRLVWQSCLNSRHGHYPRLCI